VLLERPDDGSAGVIDFGERPRIISFEFSG
jgi:hypothetical protein